MLFLSLRHALAALCTGILLVAIFAVLVIWFRSDLRSEIHQKIVERDAAVLYPMAMQQMADSEVDASGKPPTPFAPLRSLLKSAGQKGMLAIAVFDREGNTIETVPTNQFFVELPVEDYWRLQMGAPISHYHPAFQLDQYFAGIAPEQRIAPVLEVLLPLPGPQANTWSGFVRYFIDARPLSHELDIINSRINRQTAVTLLVGAVLIAVVVTAATFSIQRAQRLIAERNERLIRANFDLTLSAKASAVGQITSHLIHGLQQSVAGLHAVVTGLEASQSSPAWEIAADYTVRLQTMIQETISLLGDANAHVSYELSGHELVATIRDRNKASATMKGVVLEANDGFPAMIDSHCGSLICLIANNLVQNAITATAPGQRVAFSLTENNGAVILEVRDEGSGIPDSVRANLFKPGHSGRSGGSGLGLAISRLLARQIGAELTLTSTGPKGTTFTVTMPRRGT